MRKNSTRIVYKRAEHCYCRSLQKEDICMYCGIIVSKMAKELGILETDIKKWDKRYDS
jgi:hypothetical protein